MANKLLSKKVKTEREQTFLKGNLFTLAKDLQNLNTYAVHTFEKQKSLGNCSMTHYVSDSAKDQLKVISYAKTHHRPEMRGIYNCTRFTKFSKLLLEILI